MVGGFIGRGTRRPKESHWWLRDAGEGGILCNIHGSEIKYDELHGERGGSSRRDSATSTMDGFILKVIKDMVL